jgi:hypothetical protein
MRRNMMSSNYRVRDDLHDPITFEGSKRGNSVDVIAVENDGTTAETVVALTFSGERALSLYRALGDALEAAGLKSGPYKGEPKKAPHGAQEYRGNGKHAWETVEIDDVPFTRRLRVPGGWLYKSGGNGLVFVPVPDVVGYKI